ncbi:yae1 domain-containing protein 1-like [Scleropages formosus]|uniref:Yae1 domain-containing protein 1-like n=1 Tax=Scleropages formosus TaxID=113540 RepID=A0A0P7V4L4_SCLFO|nr:yae1 domain-containing protein 1-like [Scleropages formosus]
MSWVKSIPSSEDDVFDEDEEDTNLQKKEWRYNMEKRLKDGFRDGMDSGKEASLQHGFNMGFRDGAAKMVIVGQLKGIVSAMQCWCQLQQLDPPRLASVTELLQNIVRHEDTMIERMQMAQQHLPASVGDITDCISDLSVQHVDSCCGGVHCSGKSCHRSEGAKEDNSTFPCPSTHCSLSMEENLKQLLKSCMNLVYELDFPEELLHHVKQLMSA